MVRRGFHLCMKCLRPNTRVKREVKEKGEPI